MSKSRRRSPLSRLQKFVFEATGLPLNLVLKIVAISIIAIVGIAWTVLYTNADQDSKGSSIAATDSTRMTSEEKFKIVSVMPPDFSNPRLKSAKNYQGLEATSQSGPPINWCCSMEYSASCRIQKGSAPKKPT